MISTDDLLIDKFNKTPLQGLVTGIQKGEAVNGKEKMNGNFIMKMVV